MVIVHAADLHVDSPLRGLVPYEGAPVRAVRDATRPALENLVSHCIEVRAALLLVAGDLYDGDWRDFSTGLFFAKEMSRLREAGTRVVIVRGNHDAQSQITRSLELPANVRVLSAEAPETLLLEDLGVAVHGRSFREARVTDDLSRDYPPPVGGLLNVGLLHTCAEGRPGHDNYAPCSLEGLRSRGYDYWALGHVHQREVLSREPWIVFPGNLQGRHVRESGSKGATVIEVSQGRIASVEHVALDVVRWAELTLDVQSSMSVTDVLEAAREALVAERERSEGRVLAVRLVVRGDAEAVSRIAAHREAVTADLRALANDVGHTYFEKLKVHLVSGVRPSLGAEHIDALASLADLGDADLLAMAQEALRDMRSKLPIELTTGPDALLLDEPTTLRDFLLEAQQAILARARGEH